MNNRTLRIFILTGTLAILAIIGIQLYLLHEAFNDQQNKFSHSVQIALLEVIQKMYKQDAENLKNYRITSYNVCYTKLLRSSFEGADMITFLAPASRWP